MRQAGVLDVGCHSALLTVVRRPRTKGALETVTSRKVRLGLHTMLKPDGRLGERGMRSVQRAVAQAIGAGPGDGDVFAFATSVIRDAPNREEVIARVARATGTLLRVLPGQEEARLAYVAARQWTRTSPRPPRSLSAPPPHAASPATYEPSSGAACQSPDGLSVLSSGSAYESPDRLSEPSSGAAYRSPSGLVYEPPSGPILVLDIGGGTVELAYGTGEEPDVVHSLPFGARTVTRRWLPGGVASSPRQLREVRRHLRKSLGALPDLPAPAPGLRVLACSKTFSQLARLATAQPGEHGTRRRLTLPGVRASLALLSGTPVPARGTLPGISPHRAEQSLAGALIAEALMRAYATPTVEICPWSTREGLLLERLASR
ncbi:hypothetical protein Skr01_61830 [Sphaerisporangium krabiense]|uniref:Exopolyphosphatase/pppGpp-phosphohydrolase n=1 Tax=Sphaerisporangium krabiense TaxID=763782 RepID=A0A7W8Z2G7_9ACTN|nr:hypothetical protein [Sphaerisporangium krabiense]MBB5626236.1 exopolyphosphatase/pppGpp-phosphohydrolase [Sphaerisporangium krabiense]GII66098.1 hypothetical protein Skr01_61830 [Sphaerisporangium krabiense]